MSRSVAEDAGDAIAPLAAVVLPHILERMSVTARRLRLLAAAPVPLADAIDVDLLEGARSEAERLGWCLGVLAAGRGADLLLERREHQGLRLFVEVVSAALARDIAPCPAELPALTGRAGRGWELPLLAGWSFLTAARLRPGTLRWEFDPSTAPVKLAICLGSGFTEKASPRLSKEVLRLGEQFAPRCGFRLEGGALVLSLPADWLEDRGSLDTRRGSPALGLYVKGSPLHKPSE